MLLLLLIRAMIVWGLSGLAGRIGGVDLSIVLREIIIWRVYCFREGIVVLLLQLHLGSVG